MFSFYIYPVTYLSNNVSIILPVIVHGSETWCVAWRKEHRLKVFENSILQKIFGPKKQEQDAEESCIMRSSEFVFLAS